MFDKEAILNLTLGILLNGMYITSCKQLPKIKV